MNHLARLVCLVLLMAGITMPVIAQKAAPSPKVINGVIDLRQVNLDENSITLDGEWSFWWKKLLAPDQLNTTHSYAQFPSLWNKMEVGGQKLPNMGYATYSCIILMPKKKPVLGIQL